MKKIDEMLNETTKEENIMTVCFADDGVGVKGNISKTQHIQGLLAVVAALVERCGGDPTPVNKAIARLRNVGKKASEKETAADKEDIKVAKFSSLEDMMKYLEEEIKAKKA